MRCGLTFTSYADRLRQVNLQTLERRRLQTDLVLIFKIIYGMSDLNFTEYFVFKSSCYNLRRNSLQISPLKTHSNNQWRNIFFIRTTRVWNTLPEDLVTAPTIHTFKCQLKKLDLSKFLCIEENF